MVYNWIRFLFFSCGVHFVWFSIQASTARAWPDRKDWIYWQNTPGILQMLPAKKWLVISPARVKQALTWLVSWQFKSLEIMPKKNWRRVLIWKSFITRWKCGREMRAWDPCVRCVHEMRAWDACVRCVHEIWPFTINNWSTKVLWIRFWPVF